MYRWYNGPNTCQQGSSFCQQMTSKCYEKKRSFSFLPNTMGYYVSKKRVDPSHLAQVDLEGSIKSSWSNSQYIDLIWALCSYVAAKKVPNWTSFNYLIHKKGESEDIQKSFLPPSYRSITCKARYSVKDASAIKSQS